eukprot:gene2268-biopygen21495
MIPPQCHKNKGSYSIHPVVQSKLATRGSKAPGVRRGSAAVTRIKESKGPAERCRASSILGAWLAEDNAKDLEVGAVFIHVPGASSCAVKETAGQPRALARGPKCRAGGGGSAVLLVPAALSVSVPRGSGGGDGPPPPSTGSAAAPLPHPCSSAYVCRVIRRVAAERRPPPSSPLPLPLLGTRRGPCHNMAPLWWVAEPVRAPVTGGGGLCGMGGCAGGAAGSRGSRNYTR